MNPVRLLLLGLASAAVAFAADVVPTLNATLMLGHQTRFVLVGADGKPSSWLQIGDSFDGYALKSFDPKAGVLDLERDGKVTPVTLAADAAVANGAAAGPAPTPATLADAEAIMDKIHLDELLNRSLEMQRKIFGQRLQQIGGNIRNADPADLAAFREKVKAEFESALDVGRMKGELAKIYSETFTKDELQQMSAFYDTPLGQTLLAKQPEIQEKMQQAMLPRLAELGPKISQMTRDFAAEQHAKQAAAAAPATPAAPAAPAAPAPKP